MRVTSGMNLRFDIEDLVDNPDANIIAQEPCGVTEISKEFFLKYKNEIGEVHTIQIKAEHDEAEYMTYIIGEEGRIIVDGFSFGYYGEGPRGLEWLCERCDLNPNVFHSLIYESKAGILHLSKNYQVEGIRK